MIRRFNYTGRRKLPATDIGFRLLRSGPVMTFDAQLTNFDSLGLPPSAQIYVEAFHQQTYMRFDFGTVAQIQIPADRRLNDFYDGSPVNFRVKIVDNIREVGRILAEADGIRPIRDDDEAQPDSILPVRMVGGMGQEIWRLVWAADGPALELNQEQAGVKEILLRKHIFRSIILPEVLRSVLTRILVEGMDQDDENADNSKLWLKFIASFHDEELPGEREVAIVDEWVNRVVQSFCARHQFFDAWKAAQQPADINQP